MKLSRFNPETNQPLRAVFYAIGLGGLLHFAALFTTAIKEDNWVWFNPLFAVDFDRLFPSLKNKPLTFFGGWALFGLTAWIIYRFIKRASG